MDILSSIGERIVGFLDGVIHWSPAICTALILFSVACRIAQPAAWVAL